MLKRTLKLAVAAGLLLPAAALAAPNGGAAAPGDPVVTALKCLPTTSAPCPDSGALTSGGRIRVLGRELGSTRALIYRGGRGAADDVRVRPRHVQVRHLEATVPARARSGPLVMVGRPGNSVATVRRIRIRSLPSAAPSTSTFYLGAARRPTFPLPAQETRVDVIRGDSPVRRIVSPAGSTVTWDGLDDQGRPAGRGTYRFESPGGQASPPFGFATGLFPIRGRHDLGQTTTNNFGGGRNHKGQDLFADCGTPLAAARRGTVRKSGTDGSMGNFAVITDAATGEDHVYMHMRSVPLVTTGQDVKTGDPLGEVGDTGNASGCHLHFERWTAPGWYAGGHAVDPLPQLRAWRDGP